MNLRKLFATMAGVTAMVMVAGTASAGNFTSYQAGNWNNPYTWSQLGNLGVPGTNDTVDIYHNVAVTDSRLVQQLLIESGATVTVSGTLTMTANASPNGGFVYGGATLQITDGAFRTASSGSPVTVEGVVILDGDTPELTVNMANAVVLQGGSAQLIVDATPAAGPGYINGSGSLYSDDPANEININTGQTGDVVLTLDVATVRGAVLIQRGTSASGKTATLDNEGHIVADLAAGGDIVINTNDVVDTAASGSPCVAFRWDAGGTANLCKLVFKGSNGMTSTGLASDFRTLNNGEIDFINGATVGTAGNMSMAHSSSISADSSSAFSNAGPCSGGASPPVNLDYTNSPYSY
jgi:hypothetical protein